MSRRLALLYSAFLAGIVSAAPAANAANGRLGTLPHGIYVCSLPGDAGGTAWRELPDMGFTIGNASTYRTNEGVGTYLLTGERVTFTRGSMKGMMFDRISDTTLMYREKDGSKDRVRCVRTNAAGRF